MNWEDKKLAREHLAREQGTVVKDWGGRLPVALVYPDSYHNGMSNLGVHTLYRLLNDDDGLVCERVFLESHGNSQPLSMEGQRPLSDFAVIAFSISYELDYFNVAKILKLSGIPLNATERDERQPLIIAGGPCIIANPLPLSPFFDVLCIGEAEVILQGIFPVILKQISAPRLELLKSLAAVPGIYVSQVPQQKVMRQWSHAEIPVTTAVLTRDSEFGDMYLIEVGRGCPWGCRFCLAGQAFRPPRFRSVSAILESAEAGLKYRSRLGLVGPSVTDHPHIEELVGRLREMGAKLSVSSLRIKPICDAVLREVINSGTRTITLAPEAGSERLRQVIRKGITEDDIEQAIQMVASHGIKQLKLYFMVGLPTETDQDIMEITRLALHAKAILDGKQRNSRITLNVSSFVPKATTPFQWLGMAPLDIINRRINLLESQLKSHGIKVNADSPAWMEVQAVLARGDASLAKVIAGIEDVSLAGWRRAVLANGIDVNYFAHQNWDIHYPLPWEIIDSGNARENLEQELAQALELASSVDSPTA